MALYGRVERPECIACGLCQMLAPALFDYDQAGIAYYKPDRNTGTEPLNDQATIDFRLAYQRCRPTLSNVAITRSTRARFPRRGKLNCYSFRLREPIARDPKIDVIRRKTIDFTLKKNIRRLTKLTDVF